LHNKSDNQVTDGCISRDNKVAGTYLHGVFDQGEATTLLLHWLDTSIEVQAVINLDEHREIQLNRLADVCATHLDIAAIETILKASKSS